MWIQRNRAIWVSVYFDDQSILEFDLERALRVALQAGCLDDVLCVSQWIRTWGGHIQCLLFMALAAQHTKGHSAGQSGTGIKEKSPAYFLRLMFLIHWPTSLDCEGRGKTCGNSLVPTNQRATPNAMTPRSNCHSNQEGM